MALNRFRYEVEGVDEDDVVDQLDDAFSHFTKAVAATGTEVDRYECVDENIMPIQRNGIPLMYGRRTFKIHLVPEEEADAKN